MAPLSYFIARSHSLRPLAALSFHIEPAKESTLGVLMFQESPSAWPRNEFLLVPEAVALDSRASLAGVLGSFHVPEVVLLRVSMIRAFPGGVVGRSATVPYLGRRWFCCPFSFLAGRF